MAVMTSADFNKGQAVNVLSEGEWWRGVVTDVKPMSKKPYQVRFNANGVGDEDWFELDSIQPR
jgi:hypothetical protein